MIRVSLTISGKVQGVFFRAHIRERAKELGVTGWAANDADGTVRVIVEGSANQVNELVDWCHSGPSTAQVEKVDVETQPYMAEFDDFAIRF